MGNASTSTGNSSLGKRSRSEDEGKQQNSGKVAKGDDGAKASAAAGSDDPRARVQATATATATAGESVRAGAGAGFSFHGAGAGAGAAGIFPPGAFSIGIAAGSDDPRARAQARAKAGERVRAGAGAGFSLHDAGAGAGAGAGASAGASARADEDCKESEKIVSDDKATFIAAGVNGVVIRKDTVVYKFMDFEREKSVFEKEEKGDKIDRCLEDPMREVEMMRKIGKISGLGLRIVECLGSCVYKSEDKTLFDRFKSTNPNPWPEWSKLRGRKLFVIKQKYEGRTLGRVMWDQETISVRWLLGVCRAVIESLAVMHANNFSHNDLHVNNVLEGFSQVAGARATWTLADFGAASESLDKTTEFYFYGDKLVKAWTRSLYVKHSDQNSLIKILGEFPLEAFDFVRFLSSLYGELAKKKSASTFATYITPKLETFVRTNKELHFERRLPLKDVLKGFAKDVDMFRESCSNTGLYNSLALMFRELDVTLFLFT
jgi:hypothetical protein